MMLDKDNINLKEKNPQYNVISKTLASHLDLISIKIANGTSGKHSLEETLKTFWATK